MDQITKKIVGKISIILTAMLVVFNLGCVTAKAAPSIQVRSTASYSTRQDNTAGKTTVADLQIINLDVPSQGKLLDSFATVKTSQGIYWNIPVIWLDPQGQISSVCIPGIKYIPIFAFYLPDNIVVVNQGSSRGYSIELPEFVGQLYGEKSFLSVSNPLSGVTYITTASIVRYLGSENGPQVFNSSELKRLSTISRGNGIFDFATAQKELQNGLMQMAEEAQNDSNPSTEDSYNVGLDIAATDEQSGGSDDNQIPSAEDTSYTASGESESIPSQQPVNPDPAPPAVDLLAIHCSDNAIATIGRDNLTNLLNLIMNVIEPQAVSQLANGFQCYYDGAKENAIGKEIGLYVYDSRVDHIKDRDLEGALAYVYPKFDSMVVDGEETTTFGYYMAVNTQTLYEENENGTYTFINTEVDNLNNTITHELMHAFMYDYVRTGMLGIATDQSDYTADENAFPTWFIEGSASTVEDVYSYRCEVFGAMHTDIEDSLSDYTVDSLLTYYQTFDDEYYGNPSIDSLNKYYDSEYNTASAYVSGYLACLYMADMAVQKGYVEGKTSAVIDTYDGDRNVYSSAILRSGIDEILRRLHEGTSLDDIIKDISNGTYDNTESFQNAFLTGTYNDVSGTYENVDASADFCVDVLNYLNKVSKDLTGDSENVEYANGSVLMDFETDKTSIIDVTSADSEPEQTLYNIIDSKDFVESTVSNESTWPTAGTKGPAVSPDEDDEENSDVPSSDDEGQIAAKAPEVDATTQQLADKQITNEEPTAVSTQTDPVTNNDADESVPEDLAAQPSDEDDSSEDGEEESDGDEDSEGEGEDNSEPEAETEEESEPEAEPEPVENSQETSETEQESDKDSQESEDTSDSTQQ